MSALLKLEHLAVTLQGRRLLESLSLTLAPGEVVALLGPNGAGKTTLMRAALGLLKVEGLALLDGEEVRSLSTRQRALRAAYLPQRPQSIWPVTVENLVALGRFAYGAAPGRLSPRDEDAVDAALEACALASLRKRRMDEISGGEKTRAHLARALAQQAPLLMLDEPTAGLDPVQALGAAEIFRRHADSGGGVLFSSHDIAFAASHADRVLLLRSGSVVADGAPEDALTPGALEAAYGRKGRLERVGETQVTVFE